jgi:hypothetical protein
VLVVVDQYPFFPSFPIDIRCAGVGRKMGKTEGGVLGCSLALHGWDTHNLSSRHEVKIIFSVIFLASTNYTTQIFFTKYLFSLTLLKHWNSENIPTMLCNLDRKMSLNALIFQQSK